MTQFNLVSHEEQIKKRVRELVQDEECARHIERDFFQQKKSTP